MATVTFNSYSYHSSSSTTSWSGGTRVTWPTSNKSNYYRNNVANSSGSYRRVVWHITVTPTTGYSLSSFTIKIPRIVYASGTYSRTTNVYAFEDSGGSIPFTPIGVTTSNASSLTGYLGRGSYTKSNSSTTTYSNVSLKITLTNPIYEATDMFLWFLWTDSSSSYQAQLYHRYSSNPSLTAQTETALNLPYIYSDDSWHQAIPYIYNGTDWQMALPKVYYSSDWNG